MSGKAIVTENKCRACGCCVRNCPAGEIRLGRKKAEIGEGCVGCGECARSCPFEAIYIETKD